MQINQNPSYKIMKAYDYRNMIVEYWDLLRGDTSNWSSRPYFLDIIQGSGEPVLDVACGTGRILLDYLALGVDIDGVDISPEMIDKCQENAQTAGLKPNLYVQAMQSLDLPRRYRTIIVPSSSFLHLTDRSTALQALERLYSHLDPGGTLAMSLRVFAPEPDENTWEWEMVSEAERPTDGATVQQWFRCQLDIPSRLQNTEYRYDVLKDGAVIQSETYHNSPDLTWYLVGEAKELVAKAGFIDVRADKDFTSEPAVDEDHSFIIVVQRA